MAEKIAKQFQSNGIAGGLLEHWYPVGFSKDVTQRPRQALLAGVPLVLFRSSTQQVSAFVDRCPHRNVPLSLGKVEGDHLQCAYHGWRFDAAGHCQGVPALTRGAQHRTRDVPAFEVEERSGLIWICPSPGQRPSSPPIAIEPADSSAYLTVREALDMEAPLDAVAENALDVPHTAFLHRSLFREPSRHHRIEVRIRREADRAEAQFIGEPRPTGLLARVVAPAGGEITHCDRFISPNIAQVEYGVGKIHLVTTAALAPLAEQRTRLFATVCLRVPLPHALAEPLIRPLAMRVVRQDADILRQQTENIARFGGEDFTSTEIDVLGPHIKRLLRDAERGATTEAVERTVEMEI